MSVEFIDGGTGSTCSTEAFSASAIVAGCLAALITLLAAGSVWAQSRDPVAATELFMQGRAAVERDDYETACPLFEESSRLDLKVGTLLNLANCEEHVGQLAQALQHWRQAVQLGTATKDRRTREASNRLAALEQRVPRLTVRLAPGAPPSSQVVRDGVELGEPTLGVPLPVNPGEHRIEVRAAGHERRTFSIVLTEGDAKELTVAPGAALPPPEVPPTRAEPAPPASDRMPSAESDHTLAYVLGGVGVAGMIVGSITGAMLIQKNRTIDAQCNANHECTEAGLEAVDDAKGLVPVSNIAWVVGVVGVGAGTYLLVTAGPAGDAAPRALTRPQGIGFQLTGEL